MSTVPHPVPDPEHHSRRPYEVTHRTEYQYAEYVKIGRAHV